MTYQEQIKHPKWQKKRLEILERDGYICQYCQADNRQLHVHHLYYDKDRKIWEYNDDSLITLCDECHLYFHNQHIFINEQIAWLISHFGIDKTAECIEILTLPGCFNDTHKNVDYLNKLHCDVLTFNENG